MVKMKKMNWKVFIERNKEKIPCILLAEFYWIRNSLNLLLSFPNSFPIIRKEMQIVSKIILIANIVMRVMQIKLENSVKSLYSEVNDKFKRIYGYKMNYSLNVNFDLEEVKLIKRISKQWFLHKTDLSSLSKLK